jgi:hypothetical protein
MAGAIKLGHLLSFPVSHSKQMISYSKAIVYGSVESWMPIAETLLSSRP